MCILQEGPACVVLVLLLLALYVSSVLLVLVASYKCSGWQEMRREIFVSNDGWDVMCQDQYRIVALICASSTLGMCSRWEMP